MRTSRMMSTAVFLVAVLLISAGSALAGPPENAKGKAGKVWLCHFDESHEAVEPYTDDRNGSAPGFWTVDPGPVDYLPNATDTRTEPFYLTGDYVVRYNAGSFPGVPAGLNPGQVGLCVGNGGEFELVSVNAVASQDSDRGHRADNLGSLETYPENWKG